MRRVVYTFPMAKAAERKALYNDLLALPEHVVGEIIDGDLIVSPRPAPRHASAASMIVGVLSLPFRRGIGGPGGWLILMEPELHLRRDVLVPDVAGWRLERMPTMPDKAFFAVAPDWVCEVLSPSTAALDRSRKLRIYARAEVGHVWLVDATLRTLEVMRRDGTGWHLVDVYEGAVRVRAEPFEALEIDLSLLWD